MGSNSEKKHTIDLLLPIALFFLLAACCLVVVLLAANGYSNVAGATQENYESRTALAYVTEKIHQSDMGGGISIGTFDGRESLIIKETYGEQTYLTYIYYDDGSLKELFIQEGTDASAKSGSEILPLKEFHMEEISKGLFSFTCTTESGEKIRTTAAAISKP